MRKLCILGALLEELTVSSAPAAATIRSHYSHFEPSVVTVPAGVQVTITLRNDDPIDHEWIVGSAEVHETHRHGSEAVHAGRPTEVTVPALSTRTTTITFSDPGEFAYICHLPGHEGVWDERGARGPLVIDRLPPSDAHARGPGFHNR